MISLASDEWNKLNDFKGTVSFISRILIVLLKTERGLTKISFMVILHLRGKQKQLKSLVNLRMNLFLDFLKEVSFIDIYQLI